MKPEAKSWCEVVGRPWLHSFRKGHWLTIQGQRVTHQPQPAPTFPRFKQQLATAISFPPTTSRPSAQQGQAGDSVLAAPVSDDPHGPGPSPTDCVCGSRTDAAAETATRLNIMPAQVVRTRIVSQIGLITVILILGGNVQCLRRWPITCQASTQWWFWG